MGAVAAVIAFLLPIYIHYIIIGVIGWSIVILTRLIIYEIKRIKVEDKE